MDRCGPLRLLPNSLLVLIHTAVLLGLFAGEGRAHGSQQGSSTPINLDLYHSSFHLIEEVKSLVRRHPDKFTIDTLNGGNRGYSAEVNVITYRRDSGGTDDDSKFRILLVGHDVDHFTSPEGIPGVPETHFNNRPNSFKVLSPPRTCLVYYRVDETMAEDPVSP